MLFWSRDSLDEIKIDVHLSMSLYLSKTVFESAKLGVWEIAEEENYFSEALALTEEEHLFVDNMKGRRKIEWLSSRHLIHLMSARSERAEILKDEHGKPYIHDSEHHISFSHSHGMSAAIASLNPVGIDIQYIVPKITRIAHKFMNEVEVENIAKIDKSMHLDVMHVIWGAKESLFKAYGKKSVDFKKHMTLNIKEWNGDSGIFSGQFNKEGYQKQFHLEAMKFSNHILVFAEEENDSSVLITS